MSDIESTIKAILTNAYLSGKRPIDRQPCDITDVWIQSDLTTILALIAADRAERVEPSPKDKSFKRYNKYEVMKLDDIEKYLSPTQKSNLGDIIHTLQKGRSEEGKVPCNSYVVVKEGLPYTEQVWKLIENYETGVQPEPMPLKQIFQEHGGICTKCYGGENCKYDDVLENCPIYQKLAAHDQQVRKTARAEFAEEIRAASLDWEYPSGPSLINKKHWHYGVARGIGTAIAHIRALSEKE